MKNLKTIICVAMIALVVIVGVENYTKAQIGGGISNPILWIINGSGDLTPSIASQSISVYDIEVTNAFTLSGTVGTGGIDMNTEIITNIGNAGTDFVASTGGLILADDLEMKDDKRLYFEATKTEALGYSTDHGMVVFGDNASFGAFGKLEFYSNTSTDALGNWQPEIMLSSIGYVNIENTTQGNASDRYLYVNFDNGIKLKTGGLNAQIKADNITTTDKTFQFPNTSGTFAITSDLSAYATLALDNLASVAINTSLISDTAATDSLGSEAMYWLKGFLGSELSFEGSTDNDFQTTLTVTDPTADRTITFSDASGTVYITGGTDVAVADGGTGKSSWTQWLIPYADTTTSFSQIAIGTADQVLTSNGAGSAPTFQDAAGGGAGGVYGINVETLTGDKTLTANTNKIYQYLDEGGANRIITIATTDSVAGDRFVIRHNGVETDSNYLQVKQSTTELDKIYAGVIKEYIYDGTNWVAGENGSGEVSFKKGNISIGAKANSRGGGTAIGYDSDANTGGVAVGYGSIGSSYGASIGQFADSANYGTAIGTYTNTNSKKYSVTLGYQSETERTSEIAHNIDGGDSDQENNFFTIGLVKQTADATPIEMLCGDTAGERITIRPSSTMTFTGLITARDNVAGHGAAYKIEGAIKRDAAGNTAVLAAVTITAIHEDDASWDVTVAADDTNEALVITVTGDATNITQWAARVDGVETHF